MAPMHPDHKAALLKRLAEGRAKAKAARADAKAKGMPDPKPRKARAKKMPEHMKDHGKHAEPVDKKEAIVDPLTVKSPRETLPPIDGAPMYAKNEVAVAPVDPEMTVTSKIDVPNLPNAKSRKKIVKDAEVLVEAKDPKDLSTTGKTKGYDDNQILRNEETGNQAIPAQYPGQEESILKLLKKNKTENKPLSPMPVPNPPTKTVKNVFKHVPDMKAVESRAPFSFAAIRKVLYQ